MGLGIIILGGAALAIMGLLAVALSGGKGGRRRDEYRPD